MTICEFCGRPHQVSEFNRRFCSVLCREQFADYLGACTKLELLTEQREQGEYLRLYLRLLMKTGTLLLKETEAMSVKQQAEKLRVWLVGTTSEDNIMFEISNLLDTPPDA